MIPRPTLLIVMTLAALWLGAAGASAQPSVSVTIGRWIESTVSVMSDPSGAQTTTARVTAEHQMADERVRLFYDLDAGEFRTVGSWSYFVHTAGASSRADLGQGQNKIFFGGQVVWRANGESWSGADFGAIEGFVNAQLELRPSTTFRSGYRLDVRRFRQLEPLNQVEQLGFGSLLVNLPSRTTLIGEVEVGQKTYAGDTAVGQPISRAYGVRQSGRGSPISPEVPALPTTSAVRGPDRAGQVAWLGRVAQSLGDRTGVSLQYAQRRAFGDAPPAVVDTPPLFFEDGVYDDPYASDLDTLAATLKHVWSRGDVLEGWATWMRKPYVATPALDEDGQGLPGGPLREDRTVRVGAAWTIPVRPGRTGPADIDLIVGYVYTRSASNDRYFTYRSHQAGVSASVGF